MGGNTFKDQTGFNPASRIPTSDLDELAKSVYNEFHLFFNEMAMATDHFLKNKVDHGDIDFVAWSRPESRDHLRLHCMENGYKFKANGNMEHVLYPFKGCYHQIDFILAGSKIHYDTLHYFYSKPVVFNSVVGHFARSIGYKFSTDGFMLHVTDARKQNRYFLLTYDLRKSYEIMWLDNPDEKKDLYDSPMNFAEWILASPRFDCDLFRGNYNMKAHRDSYSEPFCGHVYDILHNSNYKGLEPPSIIDFSQGNANYRDILKREREVLGDEIYDRLISEVEGWSKVKKPIVSGDLLISLGYKPGTLFKEIIKDVSTIFNEESSEDDVVEYIKNKYSLN
jgi:hypothetical protein